MAKAKKEVVVTNEETVTVDPVVETENTTEVISQVVKNDAPVEQKIDVGSLAFDIANNKFFVIFLSEALAIAEDLVANGRGAIHNYPWFLNAAERDWLVADLAAMYNLK